MALQRRVDPGLQGQVIVDEGGGHGVDHLRVLWLRRINWAQGVETVHCKNVWCRDCIAPGVNKSRFNQVIPSIFMPDSFRTNWKDSFKIFYMR